MDALKIYEHKISELQEIGVLAVTQNLAQVTGGNLSIRGEDSDFVVTGKGTWLNRLTNESFSLLGFDGVHKFGGEASSEWRLHARIYETREDVNAIIHLHPQHVVLLHALGHRIRFITQDHAFYVGSYGHTPYYPNASDELADTAAAELVSKENNVVIMGNHGIVAVGDDIEMAFRRTANFEEAAIATYRALLLGDNETEFPEESLAKLRHS